MTRTEWVLLLGAVGVGAAAVIYWRKTQPPGASIFGGFAAGPISGATPSERSATDNAPLSDPSSLAVGTDSTDRKWYVNTTRQGTKTWSAAPNPFTTATALAVADQLFPSKANLTQ